ncbi:MAG: hypothetical protein Q9168_006271 [Polycauliona sp. 1 TL-2023]
MAGADGDQQWPPRSPFEALLSSPSGRSRVRRYQDRTSPSPSPFKKKAVAPRSGRSRARVETQPEHSEEEDDDEDEEILQLRLQALQAKLKLKQLRQKKNKVASNGSDVENERPPKTMVPPRPATTGASGERAWMKSGKAQSLSKGARPVQIPASPPRKNVPVELPKSPGRVLLGIDKGLKGKNVSLRRPPANKSDRQDSDDPFLEDALRHRSSKQPSTPYGTGRHQQGSISKPMGFSERMANIRQEDKDRKERTKRLESQRSAGFGIVKEELDRMKTVADEEARVEAASAKRDLAKPSFSREEVLRATQKSSGDPRHGSAAGNNGDKVVTRRKEFNNPNAIPGFVKPSEPPKKARSVSPPTNESQKRTTSSVSASTDDSLFEPFSSFHLTKRLIPHDSLTKALSGKSILLLPDVLGTVKAPDYCFSDDLEADIVIFATIASKSNPLSHKDSHKTIDKTATKDDSKSSLTEAAESEANARGKYMALTLTDLKWTLDLYLFTTAFTRFRKLTPGTVIAILNPAIMPPPPHNPHNNRFSLTLSSSDDTILDIGTSRDLGWCSAVKRDSKQCASWIDKRHTSVCEFHVDTQIEKTRRGRMEVNGMSAPFAPGGKRGGRMGYWGGGKGKIHSKHMPGKDYEKYGSGGRGRGTSGPEGRQYDRLNKTTFYVGGAPIAAGGAFGQTAASLLDGENLADRGAKEERLRRRLAEREREMEIARKLGERGNGMGGAYLKVRHENTASALVEGGAAGGAGSQGGMEMKERQAVDAATLGLRGNRAVDVQLSPIKKRRRMVMEGEEEGGAGRKKTRFLTAGGIKEAGRESLGVGGGGAEKEDEEELDIV